MMTLAPTTATLMTAAGMMALALVGRATMVMAGLQVVLVAAILALPPVGEIAVGHRTWPVTGRPAAFPGPIGVTAGSPPGREIQALGKAAVPRIGLRTPPQTHLSQIHPSQIHPSQTSQSRPAALAPGRPVLVLARLAPACPVPGRPVLGRVTSDLSIQARPEPT